MSPTLVWHKDSPTRLAPHARPSLVRARPAPTAAAAPDEPPAPPGRPAPVLRLLGPIRLDHPAGPTPPKAVHSCLEYLAWILEHPGATPKEMARSLLIAEPTRRSNLSRLRAWLGQADDGAPYLPDAYCGRLYVHPSVTSDWHDFRQLLGPDPTRTPASHLVAALNLVRGTPLADARPAYWLWAESLRLAAIIGIRSAAMALADRALNDNDLELGRWAVGQGLVALPEDQVLLGELLLIERHAGNEPAADQIAHRLRRQAARLGLALRLTSPNTRPAATPHPAFALTAQPALW